MIPEEVNALHLLAMDKAASAFRHEIMGNVDDAAVYFKEAFRAERAAALAVSPYSDAEPSRSILLRSAASLAVDCREFREAEKLITLGLSGDPPSELADELRDLLEVVYFHRHLDLKGLVLDPIEFQMTMVGDAVGRGVVESGQFLRRAETLERLILRTVQRKLGYPFKESRELTKKERDQFHVYFSTARAASYAITVRIGRPQQQKLLSFDDAPVAQIILDDVLTGLQEMNEDRVESLRERIGDEAYFTNFAALTKRLAPDGEKVKTVGFTSGRGEAQRIVSLARPASEIWKPTREVGKTKTFVGRVCAADESSSKRQNPVFRVEDQFGKPSPPLHVPFGMLDDIVGRLWGTAVTVTAVLENNGSLKMTDIQPLEDTSAFDEQDDE